MKPPAERPDTLTSAGFAPSDGSGTAAVAVQACAPNAIAAAAANPFQFHRIAAIAVSFCRFVERLLDC